MSISEYIFIPILQRELVLIKALSLYIYLLHGQSSAESIFGSDRLYLNSARNFISLVASGPAVLNITVQFSCKSSGLTCSAGWDQRTISAFRDSPSFK